MLSAHRPSLCPRNIRCCDDGPIRVRYLTRKPIFNIRAQGIVLRQFCRFGPTCRTIRKPLSRGCAILKAARACCAFRWRSREMVDAERLVFRAIAQTPRPCALYSAIFSRSEKKDNGPKAMQTRLRTLMGADAPACTPASSLKTPCLIRCQNVTCPERNAGRTLKIDETEAETIRTLYDLYQKLSTLRGVKERAEDLDLRSRRRERAGGRMSGGTHIDRGHLQHILSNPVYAGRIRHKQQVY